MSLLQPLMRIGLRLPAAAIPDDHGPATIFALGDVALEIEIVDRVVLGADRQSFLAERQARSSGYRPALQDAIELEAQIVVQPARGVHLDHEVTAAAAADGDSRFRGSAEVALLRVFFERLGCGYASGAVFANGHGCSCNVHQTRPPSHPPLPSSP